MSSFLQDIFNQISLQRNQSLWLSVDDSLNPSRVKLLAQFEQTKFKTQLCEDYGLIKQCKKNLVTSTILLEKANLQSNLGNIDAALLLCNQSLQFSPVSNWTECLARRSAILLKAEYFENALRDIEKCLQHKVSERQKYALIERRIKCLVALGEQKSAESEFQDVILSLNKSDLNPTKKVKLMEKLKKLIDNYSNPKKKTNFSRGDKAFPTLKSINIEFPSLSKEITVVHEAKRGRFCVANRDIKCGDLIAIENPFVWILDRSEIKKLCWHCFKPLVAPTACTECSVVFFCDDSCALEASYHKYECGITELLFQANIGAWSLAYRALVQNSPDYYILNRKLFESRNDRYGLNKETAVYSSLDIKSFHNLISHDNSGYADAPSLMIQALTALFLLRCLQYKGYLSQGNCSMNMTDEESFFVMLLHHFMRVAYFNTHEVAIIAQKKSWVKNDVKRIGRAINPSLALINHSCDPNYRRISVGKMTLGFATKTIRKGEEVTDTYSATFDVSDKKSRIKSLGKYNFTCSCIACVEDWPLLKDLPSKIEKSLCTLPAEDIIGKMKEIKELEGTASQLINDNTVDKLKVFNLLIKLREETEYIVKKPHAGLVITEMNLYQCMLGIYGMEI